MVSIILLAAGQGKRFGKPKAQVKLLGKTLLEWNLELLRKLPFTHELIVVEKGGKTRHESVKMGLQKIKGDIVIIHNVANPCAQPEDFTRIANELKKSDNACFVGQKLHDTVRRVAHGRSTTIDRADLWRVQTPQGFRRKSLLAVLNGTGGGKERLKPKCFAGQDSSTHPSPYSIDSLRMTERITDEIMLFEGSDIPIKAFESSAVNLKITRQGDLEFLERFLRTEVRTGIGEDSHGFDTSGTLVLGGLELKAHPGLKANSDGDVVLHALFNAVSSALGQGSLGKSADQMAAKGIRDSKKYLDPLLKKIHEEEWHLGNLSISLECSRPQIDPLVVKLTASLSKLLDLDAAKIGITATSGEKLSSFGKGKGIRCAAVVTLTR